MKALLLAAGKATRLGSLSRTTPKCLHRIGNEVLLDRLVGQLREVGVTEFLINTHHLAAQIANHIDSRSDRRDFTLVYEPELLGTLGTLKANIKFFGSGPGWVLHADNYIGGGLQLVRAAFDQRPEGVWGALLTFKVEEPQNYGVMTTNTCGVMTGFHEKPLDSPSTQASAATFLFGPQVFNNVAGMQEDSGDISSDLMPLLIGRLVAVPTPSFVVDVGTPAGLAQAKFLAQHSVR